MRYSRPKAASGFSLREWIKIMNTGPSLMTCAERIEAITTLQYR
jgi:hypothetical protein